MAMATLTIKITKPWWFGVAHGAALVWCRIGLPTDVDRVVARLVASMRFDVVAS
jgi:hypothetical protein